MKLEDLGWDSFFQQHFEESQSDGCIPARIAEEHKNGYYVFSTEGKLTAKVSGRLRYLTQDFGNFPAVGDWVAIEAHPEEEKATIHALLPRKSKFSRKAVLSGGTPKTGGKTEEQVLASNIDTVFLVSGLDGDFNLRRIERYVTIAWDSGATPVILLNKTDLCDDVDTKVRDVEASLIGVPILPISATKKEGFGLLRKYLGLGKTVAFLGSSGVGKSTIINTLLGYERQKTVAVREYDNKGVHTTTHREMILLPDGGLVIDTPGMREIQMWTDTEGITRTFKDIEELAEQCRFNDCLHGDEPGCAIQKAIDNGDLDAKRLQSYLKLQRELQHLSLRKDRKARHQASRIRAKKINHILKGREELRKKGLL